MLMGMDMNEYSKEEGLINGVCFVCNQGRLVLRHGLYLFANFCLFPSRSFACVPSL